MSHVINAADVSPARDFPADTTVLIAGGGPVGSAVAIDLALRGIPCVVIERRTFINPMVKAQELSSPTMEQFAVWGIADELRRRTPGHTHEHLWFRGPLAQPTLGKVSWINHDPALVRELPHVAAQREVNALLRERAVELGVPHYFGWMLMGLEQDDHKVSVTLGSTEGGEVAHVEAQYVVGADGSHSNTRKAVGIERIETQPLACHYNLGVRMPDLAARLGDIPSGINFVWTPDWHAMGNSLDAERSTWRLIIGPFPPDHAMEDDEAVQLTREFVGADVEVDLLWKNSFPVQERIVSTYSDNRVFLVGDAAHLFPPYMGQNMNIGLGDAANLGWKLAAVIQGWGGPALLDSYTEERRPIAVRTAQSAIRAWDTLIEVQAMVTEEGLPAHDAPEEERREFLRRMAETSHIEWNKDGVILDPRFESSPVMVDDGREALPWEHTTYRPQSKPGHRLPHVWLPEDRGSLYGELGPYFTLLNLGADQRQVDAATRGAAEAGVPLHVVDLTAYGLRDYYDADMVLARTDRHVVWRGDHLPADLDLWQVVAGLQSVPDTALAAHA